MVGEIEIINIAKDINKLEKYLQLFGEQFNIIHTKPKQNYNDDIGKIEEYIEGVRFVSFNILKTLKNIDINTTDKKAHLYGLINRLSIIFNEINNNIIIFKNLVESGNICVTYPNAINLDKTIKEFEIYIVNIDNIIIEPINIDSKQKINNDYIYNSNNCKVNNFVSIGLIAENDEERINTTVITKKEKIKRLAKSKCCSILKTCTCVACSMGCLVVIIYVLAVYLFKK